MERIIPFKVNHDATPFCLASESFGRHPEESNMRYYKKRSAIVPPPLLNNIQILQYLGKDLMETGNKTEDARACFNLFISLNARSLLCLNVFWNYRHNQLNASIVERDVPTVLCSIHSQY